MPELPEVETIRRGLERTVCGRTVRRILVRNPHLRREVGRREVRRAVGHRIVAVRRRAKYLVCELDDGSQIVIHLGMSGRLSLVDPNDPSMKHDHVVFCFDSDLELRFHDPRRFGMVLLMKPDELEQHRLFQHLGPEPLGDQFTVNYLATKASKRKAPVKNFLMDSRVVVGLGNIYTNEALYRAKIHPLRSTGGIRFEEWRRLRNALRRVLHNAIQQGGTTLRDAQYRNAQGELGYFQLQLRVYQREGEPCPCCFTPVVRTTLCGRSTFFCPECQKGS